MNTAVFIQARLGSSRLSEKVILDFFGQKTVLEVVIESTLKVFDKSKIFLVVPDGNNKKTLSSFSNKMGIGILGGSENNVLSRFYLNTKKLKLDGVYRICSDNPFLNTPALHELKNKDKQGVDYVGFKTADNKVGVKTHLGLWAEYCSAKALEEGFKNPSYCSFKENVTEHIYTRDSLFNCVYIKKKINSKSPVRLTLDEPLDYFILKELYSLIDFPNDKNDLELIQEIERVKVTDLMLNIINRNNKY